MRTLQDISLAGKRVLLRVDFNVPIKNNVIQDNTRIRETLPTIEHILASNPQYLLIISHQGRPEGRPDPALTLKPHVEELSRLLKREVAFVENVMGDDLPEAPIMMLENIRFYDEESKDGNKRAAFARHLAKYADVFINDAFACCHRKHASIYDIASLVTEKAAGLLLEKEITNLTPLLHDPAHPLVLVLGGAKIDTKIGVIKNFKDTADNVLIGGAMANTFLYAEGYEVGSSVYEKDKKEIAQDILMEFGEEQEVDRIMIPVDVIIADEISDTAMTADLPIGNVDFNEKILDIGKETAKKYAEAVSGAKTIIWNGPLGMCQFAPFGNGTKVVAEAIAASGAKSIVGGGDTIDALNRLGIPLTSFTHVSTGGGAMLEFLEGATLPGIQALEM